jgi:hypothetical protein
MVLVTKKAREEKIDAKVLRAFFNGSTEDKVFPGAIVALNGPLFRELEAANKVRRAGKGDKNEPVEPKYGDPAAKKGADHAVAKAIAEANKAKAEAETAIAEADKAKAEAEKVIAEGK